jgi:hypothetical protein
MLTLFFAIFAFASVNPEATFSALHCKPAITLRGEVKSCDGNDAYSMAAALCLKKFEDSATEFQKALAVAGAANGQLAAEASARAKYTETLHALDVMISTSDRLKTEIQAYKSEVVLPDDLGPVEDGAMEITDFLRNNPCYHMTQDLVEQTADVMHFKCEELRWTRKIAEAQLKRAGLRASVLDAGSAAPAAHGVSSAAGPGAAAPVKQGGSTITGVEQDKAKQKK